MRPLRRDDDLPAAQGRAARFFYHIAPSKDRAKRSGRLYSQTDGVETVLAWPCVSMFPLDAAGRIAGY